VAFGFIATSWNHEAKLQSVQLIPGSGAAQVAPTSDVTVIHDLERLPHYLVDLIRHLELYFQEGQPLPEIPWQHLDLDRASEFQKGVYQAICKIPHGQTRTYAWVAIRMGKPQATRAVGQALKKNPFPVLIPCHRVIGAAGDLVGFMGKSEADSEEISLKSFLIQAEYQYRNPIFSFLKA